MKIIIDDAIDENGYLKDIYSKYAPNKFKYKDQPVLSPPFKVLDLPENTKYISWTLIDHDANEVVYFSWIHWLVANQKVNGATIEIPEGFDSEQVKYGTNSFASPVSGSDDPTLTQHYVGPTPPDAPHAYTLTVYASYEPLSLDDGFTLNKLFNENENKCIEMASIKMIGIN